MRKLISMICIVFFVSIGYGQDKSNRIKMGLFSPHEENFEYVNGKVKEIHYQTFHITDEDGKVVKGKPFTYDEAFGVQLREPRSYYYNESGQLIKMEARDDSQNILIWLVKYNKDRIEKINVLRNDTLYWYSDFQYQDNGDIVQTWTNLQDNQFTNWKKLYKLDKKGNLLKWILVNPDGETTHTSEYTRDEDGKTKTKKQFNAEGKLMWYFTDYEYNEKGLLKACKMKVANGEIDPILHPGDLSLQSSGKDQVWDRIEYKFDDHGNWIKMVHPGWIMIERNIEYYD